MSIDMNLFKWCDPSALDELEEKTDDVVVLGYDDFLKIPVSELYEKNKAMREERIKKDIEEAKKHEEETIQRIEADINSQVVFDTINFTDVLELD